MVKVNPDSNAIRRLMERLQMKGLILFDSKHRNKTNQDIYTKLTHTIQLPNKQWLLENLCVLIGYPRLKCVTIKLYFSLKCLDWWLRQKSPSMIEDIERRTIDNRFNGVVFGVIQSPYFLQWSCWVNNSNHRYHQTQDSLKEDVNRKEALEVLFHES